MKIRMLVMLGGMLAGSAMAQESREVAGAVFELRAVDPGARTITLLGASGEQTLRVDDRTLLAAAALAPGERILVSYRYNRNAEAEVTLRRIPGGFTPVAEVGRVVETRPVAVVSGRADNRVTVLAAEPRTATLEIRDAEGRHHRLTVDASIAADLGGLRPGDHVIVDRDAGRVVGIARAR
jgi:hypothetical protein